MTPKLIKPKNGAITGCKSTLTHSNLSWFNGFPLASKNLKQFSTSKRKNKLHQASAKTLTSIYWYILYPVLLTFYNFILANTRQFVFLKKAA